METIQLNKKEWKLTDCKIGKGGFGKVYQGTDLSGKLKVAIKIVQIEDWPERERQIIEELCKLSGYSNVIPVLDYGTQCDLFYLVMPIADQTLKDYISSNSPFDQKLATSILLDVASGIEEIKEIVHRDIKPANILLHDGVWKIADFGIARDTNRETSANTIRARSKFYAAPEQWEDGKVTKAIDIYSLGCLAFEILEGQTPFGGPNFRRQHTVTPPPRMVKTANLSLQQLVIRMLHKEPTHRPTIGHIITALKSGFPITDRKTDQDTVGRLAFKALQIEERNQEEASRRLKATTELQKLKAIEETSWLPLHLIMKEFYRQLCEVVVGIDNTASVIFVKGSKISIMLPTIMPIPKSGGSVLDLNPAVNCSTRHPSKIVLENAANNIYATAVVNIEWGRGCHRARLVYSGAQGELEWFEQSDSGLVSIQGDHSQEFFNKLMNIIADHIDD